MAGGAIGADRTRGSAAVMSYGCSVVAWPCLACSLGCCRVERMLYTMATNKRDSHRYRTLECSLEHRHAPHHTGNSRSPPNPPAPPPLRLACRRAKVSPKEACAIARYAQEAISTKGQEINGSSVAYKTVGTFLSQRMQCEDNLSRQASSSPAAVHHCQPAPRRDSWTSRTLPPPL